MNKRNMASSVIEHSKPPQATWTRWTTANAVKEGYKISGWVFKAVSLIARNISTVPWIVTDRDGEHIPDHPISMLLKNPNPAFSKQDFFELLAAWQQLSGEAYVSQVFVNGTPSELWPISPDRITPIASADPTELISGYEIVNESGSKVRSEDFTNDNVISFRFLDPSDPMRGIGPLQVAAKAVDVDNEQQNWNKSAMQNRGVLDGVFTFDRDLDQNTYHVVKQRLKEMFTGSKNARDIGVVGSNAKYQRLSLTPAEMDFITSRRFNREEIFGIFGVPMQLIGSEESSTFNNVSESRVIFWELTLIPILEDLSATFNRVFEPYLGEGLTVDFDLSNIPALKKDQKQKAETAEIYSKMGVPVRELNEMFTLGIPEYEGWDKAVVQPPQQTIEQRGSTDLMPGKLSNIELRSVEDDIANREDIAKRNQKEIEKGLQEQQAATFAAMENREDIAGVLSNNSEILTAAIQDLYQEGAFVAADNILVEERRLPGMEVRAIDENLMQIIDEVIATESIILTELSMINSSTVNLILGQIIDGEEEGKSINQIQRGILDSGTFSSERALRIARTVSGTAQSVGQMAAALSVGATKKTWHDADFEVRTEHQARDGETVGINERFSKQFDEGLAPRWPLDQQASVSDRVNCRCSLTFSM